MKKQTSKLVLALIALLALGCSPNHEGGKLDNTPPPRIPSPQSNRSAIDYEIIGLNNFPYACFLVNWDFARIPVFYTLIRSAADYDQYFHPAPIMGNQKPFAPDSSLYSNYHLLTVARAVFGSETKDEFTVDSLIQRDKELFLYYSYEKKNTSGSWTMKAGLVLKIPKLSIDKVILTENNRIVGELDIK